MNANKTQKFVAVFAIALMIASIFVMPALAKGGADDSTAGSGSSGSGGSSGGDGSLEDDIVGGDLIRGRGDENEVRGGGDENEIRGNGDENEIRGGDDDSLEIRGRGSDDFDDDSCNDRRRGRGSSGDERIEITSDSFGGSTEVKIKLDFVTSSGSSEGIANDILERLKLGSSEVDSMLVMDDDMEDMIERTRIDVKDDNGGQRVRFEMKFPLNVDERASVVEGITSKLSGVKLDDLDSDGDGNLEDDIVGGDMIRGRGDEVEASGSLSSASAQEIRSRNRGIVDDLSDAISGIFGAIFGVRQNEPEPKINDGSTTTVQQTAARTKLDAKLLSSANLDLGEAEFEIQAGRKVLSVTVENMANLGLAQGDVVSVFVKDIFAGDVILAVTPLRGLSGNLNLDTLNGATVPDVAAGDSIRVVDIAGATILSGTFAARAAVVTIATAEQQAAAGIIITGGVGGPGYPTGPLNIVVPSTQLLLDRVGQVKGAEVKDRQYEVEFAAIPITINGVANTATEVKVISNLKAKNGVGQHQGTIDVDIDVLPAAGHVTLQYNGAATIDGSTIASKGTFKTVKTTGIFAGLVAEGTYNMVIVEPGSTLGSPATVTISTASV